LEAFKKADSWHTVSGNLLLNIRECRQQWSVAQRLLGRIRLKPIRNFGNPGGFDYRQYLANQRIWLRGHVRRDTDLVAMGQPEHDWGYLLDSIRARSRAFLVAWLPPDLAGLYRALLLGERYALSAELRELLYDAGIGHLLAISGLHLGLVAGFAFLAFHFVLVRIPAVTGRWGARPGAALAAFPLALGYGLLTGMGLPALRATLMIAVFTFALVSQREKDLRNSLFLAAFVILGFYPEALFSASFQLSFIGVAALVWIVPVLPVPPPLRQQDGQEERWRRLGCRFYQFFCGSLILSVFTAPVVLYHFHRLTPLGILTNLVAVPVVGFLILPAGLLALLFMPCSTLLAGFLLTLGSLGLKIVIALAARFTSLSWATVWPGTPGVWQVGLAYVLLLVPLLKTTRRWRVSLLIIGCLGLVASWLIPNHLRSAQSFLQVTYLDVSQGSSAVVEFPGNSVMLIDGGGFHRGSFDIGRHVVAPYLWHRRIGRLEAMVLSHAHPDHFQGLRFVATHFSVKQFWYNGVYNHAPDFVHFMKRLVQKDILLLGPQELQAGQNIKGVNVQVLHPPPDLSSSRRITTDRALNNLSLVVRLSYKNVSFLFPGDIEKMAEYRLAKLPCLEPVDVLLVPHHGSRTSSSLEFLQRLRPRIAVYSVGFDNPFRLPSTRVLERYRELGIKTYRTDRHGAITVRTDGHNIEVETFLPQEKGRW
jgi:competence protein ComEC